MVGVSPPRALPLLALYVYIWACAVTTALASEEEAFSMVLAGESKDDFSALGVAPLALAPNAQVVANAEANQLGDGAPQTVAATSAQGKTAGTAATSAWAGAAAGSAASSIASGGAAAIETFAHTAAVSRSRSRSALPGEEFATASCRTCVFVLERLKLGLNVMLHPICHEGAHTRPRANAYPGAPLTLCSAA